VRVYGLFVCAIPFLLLSPGCMKAKTPHGAAAFATVARPSAPPVIDGVLDDECWKKASASQISPPIDFVLAEDGKKPRQSTSLRMLADSTYLYLAFECQDRDAASDVTQFDGPVEDQDCVALLIDAGSDSTGYFMIAVSPTGAVHDAYVLNAGNGQSVRTLSCWNCEKLLVSVSVYGAGAKPGNEDRFWSVEMAVPFSQILTAPHIPPSPGDTWRVNFARMDVTGGRELSAALPTGAPDMHRPYSFGNLRF
jgi:hypothetical protein